MARESEATLNLTIYSESGAALCVRIWRTLHSMVKTANSERALDDYTLTQLIGEKLRYEIPHITDHYDIAHAIMAINDSIAAVEVQDLYEGPHEWKVGTRPYVSANVKRGVVVYREWP